MRNKYGLPVDKKIFVYGGNLGRPQDVPFIVKCLEACKDMKNVYFLVVGSGTEKHYLDEYVEKESCSHVRVMGNCQNRNMIQWLPAVIVALFSWTTDLQFRIHRLDY